MSTVGYHQAFVRLRSTTGQWLVHPELRERLVEDAQAAETNLTDVAAKILADQYKVRYEPNGRRTAPKVDDEVLNMRLPARLWTAICVAAARNGRKDMDEVRHALCAHYGLRMPPPLTHIRRPRRPRAAA